MSFRTEDKFLINQNRYVDLKKYLILNGATKKFPNRIVRSIYFDNINFQAFIDSQEGSVVRKKIRIRSYKEHNTSSNIQLLEFKISSVEGRYKTSKKLNACMTKKLLNYGYYDSLYGICNPIIEIEYKREYFFLKNGLRVTIDKGIQFSKYKNPIHRIKNYSIVMEVKNDTPVCASIIINQFPFIKNRFSKFSIAIQALYNKAY